MEEEIEWQNNFRTFATWLWIHYSTANSFEEHTHTYTPSLICDYYTRIQDVKLILNHH